MSSNSPDSGQGFMGGAPGDGFVGNPHNNAMPYGMNTNTMGGPPPNFQQQQPQPQGDVGSITRFAGDIAAINNNQYGMQQPGQPGPIGMQVGVGTMLPQQQNMQYNTGGMQQYQQQQQQPQYNNMPNQGGMMQQNPGGMGVGMGGMQQNTMQNYGGMQQQPVFQGGMQPPSPMQQQQYGAASGSLPPGPQYRQNPQQQQQPSTILPQQQQPKVATAVPSSAPAGSYAARSAQAYATGPGMGSVTASYSQQPPVATNRNVPGMANSYGQVLPNNFQQQQFPNQPQSTASPYTQQQPTNNMSQQPQQQPEMYGQQTPHQPQYQQQPQPGNSTVIPSPLPAAMPQQQPPMMNKPGAPNAMTESPAVIALQNRLLTDATRKVQEHAYYMRQAMDKNDLPTVLERAALMVGELGEHHSHGGGAGGNSTSSSNTQSDSSKLNPKNYYELHMRALEDMPNFEEYLLNLSKNADNNYTMRELYDCVQYCPHVLSRLYLQISAGSALIRSGEVGAKYVLNDLVEAVRCVQNPLRGLFLRHFLLQALRDKLPDNSSSNGNSVSEQEQPASGDQERGTVVDSYEFVLVNFIEMNKLWVRIQHLPGDGKSKEQRRKRERERNELRVLVGTNLVRLSQLEGVTSQIYGEIILPKILDHIAVCGDPLAQAYLMDCITQAFPDEYHIETLPILLRVCPRLRDKVNIRTILQSLMDRLANYLADEELLNDETDSNQVKKNLARDSFPMFEECVQNVYNARGPKLTSKEVIRLQTALLSFTIRCYKHDVVIMDQVSRCLSVCVSALRQASSTSYEIMAAQQQQQQDGNNPAGMNNPQVGMIQTLDEVSVTELEKLLSIPLDSLALKVLHLNCYGELIGFLPWKNRREVALKLLTAVNNTGKSPESLKEIEELFTVIEPVLCDNTQQQQLQQQQQQQYQANPNFAPPYGNNIMPNVGGSSNIYADNASVSKLVQLFNNNEDTDVVYEMLAVAKQHIVTKQGNSSTRNGQMLVAVVFTALRLARRVFDLENPTAPSVVAPSDEEEKEKEQEPTASDEPKIETEVDKKNTETVTNEESECANTTEIETKDDNTKVDNAEESAAERAPIEEDKKKEESLDLKTDADIPVAAGPAVTKSVSCRKVFIFIQQTIATVAMGNSEIGIKLYLEAALTADNLVIGQQEVKDIYGPIAYELFSQSYSLYEQGLISDSKTQQQCITNMIGTLLGCRSWNQDDYERLIMKTAQYAAKLLKKHDQCNMVASCAHLFYPIGQGNNISYRNPQRALECLQRALKLADACTSMNPAHVSLFVDLLDHYVYFFEKKNPVITSNYITGLLSLIQEHFNNLGASSLFSPDGSDSLSISDAKNQFYEIVQYIKRKKEESATAELFAPLNLDQF